jgi:hypothetical protein
MYTIIGGDGKEYGPVSGEDLRKWIAEGRLNAQSLAKAESDAEFRPLSMFPELVDAFGSGMSGSAPTIAPSSLESNSGRQAALAAVKWPAMALIVTASLGMAYYLFSAIYVLTGGAFQQELPADAPAWVKSFVEGARGPLAGGINLVVVAVNGFVLFGAIKFLRLQNFGLVMAAVIIAMLPCQCCCMFGLPFGIWALIVLNKPEVKSQFG